MFVSSVLKGTHADACGGNEDMKDDKDDEGLVQFSVDDDGSLAQLYGEVLVPITDDGSGSLVISYGEVLVQIHDVGRGSLDLCYGEDRVQINVDGRGSLVFWYGEVCVPNLYLGRGSLDSWYGEVCVPKLDVGRGSLEFWYGEVLVKTKVVDRYLHDRDRDFVPYHVTAAVPDQDLYVGRGSFDSGYGEVLVQINGADHGSLVGWYGVAQANVCRVAVYQVSRLLEAELDLRADYLTMGWGGKGKGDNSWPSSPSGSSYTNDGGKGAGDARTAYGLLYKEREKLQALETEVKAKSDREERARELQAFKDEIRGALRSTPKVEDSIYQSMVKSSSEDKDKELEENPSLVRSLWKSLQKMAYRQKGERVTKDEESGKKRHRSPSTASSSSSRRAKKRSKKDSSKKSSGHYNKSEKKEKKEKNKSKGGKSSSSKHLPTKSSESSEPSSAEDMKLPEKKAAKEKSSPKGAKDKKDKCDEKKNAKQFTKNVEGLQKALWNLPDKLETPEYDDTESTDEFVKKLATSPSCTIVALKELAKANGVNAAWKNKDKRIRTLINFKIDKAEGDDDE